MSSASSPTSSASVRNILTLLASRDAHLIGGAEGLERRVTWSCRMRARLPAFESMHGGELALLALPQLRRLDETLPHLLKSLYQEGVAAIGVSASSIGYWPGALHTCRSVASPLDSPPCIGPTRSHRAGSDYLCHQFPW